MQIGPISTTFPIRRTTDFGPRTADGTRTGSDTATARRETSPSSAPNLRSMTPNALWDYSSTLKDNGQISDVDVAILNPAAFPYDASAETGDFASYLTTIRNTPMDHVERLETDISNAQTSGEKARLQDLLDRIRQIAAAQPVDRTV